MEMESYGSFNHSLSFFDFEESSSSFFLAFPAERRFCGGLRALRTPLLTSKPSSDAKVWPEIQIPYRNPSVSSPCILIFLHLTFVGIFLHTKAVDAITSVNASESQTAFIYGLHLRGSPPLTSYPHLLPPPHSSLFALSRKFVRSRDDGCHRKATRAEAACARRCIR